MLIRKYILSRSNLSISLRKATIKKNRKKTTEVSSGGIEIDRWPKTGKGNKRDSCGKKVRVTSGN